MLTSNFQYSSILTFFFAVVFTSCSDSKEDDFIIPDIYVPLSSVEATGLPIIRIETMNGSTITDKETWIESNCSVCDNGISSISEQQCRIKGRGNVSWDYPKKSFNLYFVQKQSLLGMPRHRKWVFLANYHDKTLMRNSLTMAIGQQCRALEWTPHGRYAEVILNGCYIGNYWICEKIDVASNRIAIEQMSADCIKDEELTGGYLLEFDTYFDGENLFYTKMLRVPVVVRSPDDEVCQDTQIDYIRNFINKTESLLLVHRFDTLFEEYLDLDSFVDYLIVQTLSNNKDFFAPRSVYCYKKRNGKLYAGPLWDFDYSTYTDTKIRKELYSAWWYRYLLKSTTFKHRMKERWQEQRHILQIAAREHIEKTTQQLSISKDLNWELWPMDGSKKVKAPNRDEFLSFSEAVARMDSILNIRFQTMDEWIDAL